ncbi:MAG: AarF/UbiB family protein, partial [Nanoarchaeota archaeon]
MHLKQDLRDLKRLEEILKVFMEEGWGYYLHRAKLHYHLPFLQRWRPHFPFKDKEEQAARLRRVFERLGPTFIKLGQLLSLRPDLVPEEFCKEFEKLQDHVPTFPLNQAIKIIEEDLGQPIHKLFRKFESKPVAAASMAQVYRAELKNGKEVAVKVQRPNVKEIIDADLDLLFFLAHQLENHFPTLRKNRPVDIVREFALWTRKELNFDIEARSALRLKEELKNNP